MAVWKHTSGRYETDAPGFTVAVVNYGNGYGWYVDEGDGRIRRFFRTAVAGGKQYACRKHEHGKDQRHHQKFCLFHLSPPF